jgi:hypothetical protein
MRLDDPLFPLCSYSSVFDDGDAAVGRFIDCPWTRAGGDDRPSAGADDDDVDCSLRLQQEATPVQALTSRWGDISQEEEEEELLNCPDVLPGLLPKGLCRLHIAQDHVVLPVVSHI